MPVSFFFPFFVVAFVGCTVVPDMRVFFDLRDGSS